MQPARNSFFRFWPALLGTVGFLMTAWSFATPANAADAEYKLVLILPTNDAVLVRLPLTDVTGKVRVKEKTPDGFGIPIAPSKTALGKKHYLEWQIGYDSPNTNSGVETLVGETSRSAVSRAAGSDVSPTSLRRSESNVAIQR